MHAIHQEVDLEWQRTGLSTKEYYWNSKKEPGIKTNKNFNTVLCLFLSGG